MEILKGFEFQLQRFAGLDISGITEPASMTKSDSFEVIEDGNGGYKLADAGTSNSVLTIGLFSKKSNIEDIILYINKITTNSNIPGGITLPNNQTIDVTDAKNNEFTLGNSGGIIRATSFKTNANNELKEIATNGAEILAGTIWLVGAAKNQTSVTLTGGSLRLEKDEATNTTVTSTVTGDVVIKADASAATVIVAHETAVNYMLRQPEHVRLRDLPVTISLNGLLQLMEIMPISQRMAWIVPLEPWWQIATVS